MRAKVSVVTALRALELVKTCAFRPKGPRYDTRSLLKNPVRAIRGGPNGLAVRYRVRDGSVELSIFACGQTSADDVARAVEAARGLAALDDDPSEFVALALRDPCLKSLVRRFDTRLPRTPTVFEAYAEAVLGQLVTSYEARVSARRLWAHAGERIEGTPFRAAPTAKAVLGVPAWRLHTMGIGSRRIAALREGAKRGAALERLRDVTPDVAVEKMQSLRGIGPWTANLVAQKALAWADAVPVGDLHAPYVITEALTGERGGDEEMLAALEPYRPHRARVAALFMNAGIVSRDRPLPRVDAHRREPWKY